MRTCYQIAEIISSIASKNATSEIQRVLPEVIPDLNAPEVRIRVVGMFNEAIEQVALLFHLEQDAINDMLSQLKKIQSDAFIALAQSNVAQFKSSIKYPNSVTTLKLIGNATAAIPTQKENSLSREDLQNDILQWLTEIEELDISSVQRMVLTIKLRSLLRFLIECKGATNEEVLRRLKSLADDLTVELDAVGERERPTLVKIRDALMAPVRHSTKVLSLASDTLSVAAVLGPMAFALLPVQEPVKSLPPPQPEASSSSSEQ